jgi:hypothetical protein
MDTLHKGDNDDDDDDDDDNKSPTCSIYFNAQSIK